VAGELPRVLVVPGHHAWSRVRALARAPSCRTQRGCKEQRRAWTGGSGGKRGVRGGAVRRLHGTAAAGAWGAGACSMPRVGNPRRAARAARPVRGPDAGAAGSRTMGARPHPAAAAPQTAGVARMGAALP